MNNNQKEKIKTFTDLKVWQKAHSLVLEIYKVTKEFPKEEIFALSSQMKRCAVSVTSNIAEGFGRQGYKEKIQFYYFSQGSLTELKNQLLIAKDIGYLENDAFNKIAEETNEVHKLLQGFIKKSKEILNHTS